MTLLPGTAGSRARLQALRRALGLTLGLGLCVGSPSALADMEVRLDAAPGSVWLPDNWRPIPRAEIVEARERATRSVPMSLPRLPVAAFQRLPTLQWFALPHALVYWQAEDVAAAASSAAGTAGEPAAPDVQVTEDTGRGPHGMVVHTWHCTILRHDGRFQIDLLTPDDDGREVILGLAKGLRDHP